MIAFDTNPATALPAPLSRRRGSALALVRSALGPLGEQPLGRLRSAREVARERADDREEHGPLATGHPAFDSMLGGGLPRGELVEVVGARASGRLSLVLSVLAGVTSTGESAALVDLGDHLEPAAAAAIGVDLQRLLWVRPRTMRETLAAAEMVLGGGFPLVVVDLGSPPLAGGRGIEAGWLRLARAARAQGAALLVASPYRVSGTAAAAVLQARGARAVWEGQGGGRLSGSSGSSGSPRLLRGLSSRLQVEKRRGALPGEERAFTLATSTLALSPDVPTAPRSLPVPSAKTVEPVPRARMAAGAA